MSAFIGLLGDVFRIASGLMPKRGVSRLAGAVLLLGMFAIIGLWLGTTTNNSELLVALGCLAAAVVILLLLDGLPRLWYAVVSVVVVILLIGGALLLALPGRIGASDPPIVEGSLADANGRVPPPTAVQIRGSSHRDETENGDFTILTTAANAARDTLTFIVGEGDAAQTVTGVKRAGAFALVVQPRTARLTVVIRFSDGTRAAGAQVGVGAGRVETTDRDGKADLTFPRTAIVRDSVSVAVNVSGRDTTVRVPVGGDAEIYVTRPGAGALPGEVLRARTAALSELRELREQLLLRNYAIVHNRASQRLRVLDQLVDRFPQAHDTLRAVDSTLRVLSNEALAGVAAAGAATTDLTGFLKNSEARARQLAAASAFCAAIKVYLEVERRHRAFTDSFPEPTQAARALRNSVNDVTRARSALQHDRRDLSPDCYAQP